MADNIEGMNINSTVKYRTKVSSDPNTYIGEIQSMMNFHAAITMGCDAIAITNQVKLELISYQQKLLIILVSELIEVI